ncbi:MAG: metallophosphoesterase [Mangrovibacterium sp.]
MILSIGLMLSVGYGIFISKRSITIEHLNISFKSLPKQLDGLTLMHISDFHLGSFKNDATLRKCARKMNELKPDIILFTGDMVNNFSEEIIGKELALKEMDAKYGKYAIYGNHDYGDYSNWDSPAEKMKNFEQVTKHITDADFIMLDNANVKLQVNDTCLYIIGVQNWGYAPFPQYADLEKATRNIPEQSFKILLTHDPAHWEVEVTKNTTIPLTLSGHTHAGQLGIKISGIAFSPMYFIEHLWNGLYSSGEQKLYVNRGLGCVGFPGRIEMTPEITLITLKKE